LTALSVTIQTEVKKMSTDTLSKPNTLLAAECASTIMEMLQREGGNHPLRQELRFFSEEAAIRDGTTASIARMPKNAVAVYVFREFDGKGPGYGSHRHGDFKVMGMRLMTIACFFEGNGDFMVRSHVGDHWETFEFSQSRFPDAIATACRMLRNIR